MEANQCDGCKRGLAVKDKIHFEKDGKPYIGCSSSLYEKSHRPSDLEIVQKALERTGLELLVGKDWILICGEDNYSSDDAVEVYYSDWNALLTWAKQTIGID